MRYAPSAQNARSWKYIILQDKEKIDKIRQAVIKMIKLLKKLVDHKKVLKYFMPKSIREVITNPNEDIALEDFLERIDKGEDPVFYNAPVLIITYASELNRFADNDAGIALTHGILAAQSRGLGTCWIGYAQEAINRYKDLKKLLKIPKEMNINGVLILGHPDVEYHRIPPRETLDVKWL
jgi:nitroreductase